MNTIIIWSSKTIKYIQKQLRPIGTIFKCGGNSKNDSGLVLTVESPTFKIPLPIVCILIIRK